MSYVGPMAAMSNICRSNAICCTRRVMWNAVCPSNWRDDPARAADALVDLVILASLFYVLALACGEGAMLAPLAPARSPR